ncbi:MAG: hypothetical protein ABR514_06880 [Chthoniobacterales bacterium]
MLSARSGIDFTASMGERTLAGIKFSELHFHENDRKISYEQPRGWSYSGDATHIKFVPPDVRQAVGEFSQAPLSKPQNFDEETMKLLQAAVLAAMPPDSQDVAVVSAEKNPLMINQHETFEVIVTYQLFSERFQQSVLFMNLPDTQLTFRFVSRKSDFEKLHRAFRGSLCSLQWL